MADYMDEFRQNEVNKINNEVESNNEFSERKRLEDKYGQVWDTQELQKDFIVKSFLAPYVLVMRKSDKAEGTLLFQHMPRFYFEFRKK